MTPLRSARFLTHHQPLQEKEARETAAKQHTNRLKAANLAIVETLFRDMFDDDEEHAKLKALPGIQELIKKFASEFQDAAQSFQEVGMEIDAQKRAEREAFSTALDRLRAFYSSESVKATDAWKKAKKNVFRPTLDGVSVPSMSMMSWTRWRRILIHV